MRTHRANNDAAAGSAGRSRSPRGGRSTRRRWREVRALLGDRPRRRDLLIEHLHLIQDRYRAPRRRPTSRRWPRRCGWRWPRSTRSPRSTPTSTSSATASPPRRRSPSGSATASPASSTGPSGSARRSPSGSGPGVRVVRAPCMGRCERAPVAVVGQRPRRPRDRRVGRRGRRRGADRAGLARATHRLRRLRRGGRLPPARATAARAGTTPRRADRGASTASGLRGLGGAGFRSGQKWRLVRQAPAPRLMAINADEGEPGTFKDRYYLETDPHRFLEGMLDRRLGGRGRGDLHLPPRRVPAHPRDPARGRSPGSSAEGLARPARDPPPAGRRGVHLRRGDGDAGEPRREARLPPAEAAVPDAGRALRPADPDPQRRDASTGSARSSSAGPDWLAAQGRNGRQRPAELLGLGAGQGAGRQARAGGDHGPRADRRVLRRDGARATPSRATCPAGASGGILPARLADVPLDFGTLEPHGCFIGSAAVVVLSDRDDIRAVALNLMRFFEDESCGQCTPCRCGTEKAVQLMERPAWDEPLLTELSAAMRDASICGLGQAAPNPLLSVLQLLPGGPRDDRRPERPTTPRRRLHARRPRGRRPARRDDLAGRPPRGDRDPPPLLLARARLPARRQLPGLHGRDRGRARPRRLVHPPADARHEGRDRLGPRRVGPRRWSSSCSSPTSRRATTAHDPDSKFWRWAERVGVTSSRFPARHAPRARPQPPGDGRPARRLHPVRPLRPRLPRGPGQRRHRHGLPRPRAPRSSSTSTTRWAGAPASPAASASRPARPAP